MFVWAQTNWKVVRKQFYLFDYSHIPVRWCPTNSLQDIKWQAFRDLRFPIILHHKGQSSRIVIFNDFHACLICWTHPRGNDKFKGECTGLLVPRPQWMLDAKLHWGVFFWIFFSWWALITCRMEWGIVLVRQLIRVEFSDVSIVLRRNICALSFRVFPS